MNRKKFMSAALGTLFFGGCKGPADPNNQQNEENMRTENINSTGFVQVWGPDGQTVIENGEIHTDELYAIDATIFSQLNVGGVVYIGAGVSDQEIGERVLVGTTTGGVPYVRAQQNGSNYVQMVGNTGQPFFEIVSGGNDVLTVDSSGLSMGGNFEITNANGDYTLTEDGLKIETSNAFLESRSLHFGNTPSSAIWHNQLTGTLTFEALENIFIDSGNSSAGGNITIHLASGTLNDGNLIIQNLPVSDPGVPGALWNDGGTLKIS